jgi:hypothetical protein
MSTDIPSRNSMPVSPSRTNIISFRVKHIHDFKEMIKSTEAKYMKRQLGAVARFLLLLLNKCFDSVVKEGVL